MTCRGLAAHGHCNYRSCQYRHGSIAAMQHRWQTLHASAPISAPINTRNGNAASIVNLDSAKGNPTSSQIGAMSSQQTRSPMSRQSMSKFTESAPSPSSLTFMAPTMPLCVPCSQGAPCPAPTDRTVRHGQLARIPCVAWTASAEGGGTKLMFLMVDSCCFYPG